MKVNTPTQWKITAWRSKPGQSNDPEQKKKKSFSSPSATLYLLYRPQPHTHTPSIHFTLGDEETGPCVEQIPQHIHIYRSQRLSCSYPAAPSPISLTQEEDLEEKKRIKRWWCVQNQFLADLKTWKMKTASPYLQLFFKGLISTVVAHAGRKKEHMARASGDGYNRLLGPHNHLFSQQALLSKGRHCKEGLCLLLIWLFLCSLFLPSTLLSFLCDTARRGNMTPTPPPGPAQPSPLKPGWVLLTVPSPTLPQQG